MIVTNTFYQQLPHRLHTWKVASEGCLVSIRNQSDYFIIRRRFKNAIKPVKALPDYNPIVKLKKVLYRLTTEIMNTRSQYDKVEDTINCNPKELKQ